MLFRSREGCTLRERVLPQGASTSPAITNALCSRLDARLDGLARSHGFAFTRYADDLTLSGPRTHPKRVDRLVRSMRAVLASEGFAENPAKTRVMRAWQSHEVTGLNVNVKVTVPRRYYRALRATLHNCETHGFGSQNRTRHPDFVGMLRGKVEFIASVDPSRGAKLRESLARAINRWNSSGFQQK